MKGRPIDALVHEQIFRNPKVGECQNFSILLQRYLVPEVRLETAAFYGNLDTKEAQYPGLDYSHPPHRMRLSRFPWHRKLFRAFDNLGLTRSEIATLTKWEGTRWAKERFEKEQGIKIEDTTGKEIADWVDPMERETAASVVGQDMEVEQMELVEEEEVVQEEEEGEVDEDDDEDETQEEGEEEEDSEVEGSVVNLSLRGSGPELTDDALIDRLRARANVRNIMARHENSIPESGYMDEQWEQWMKEIAEAGENDLGDIRSPPALVNSTWQARLSSRRETYVPSAAAAMRPAETRNPSRTFTTTNPFSSQQAMIRAPVLGSFPQDISNPYSYGIEQPRQAQPPRS